MVKAPGMVDVARLAGVSHVTVSRVLNGHPPVRPETRAKVEAAIEELGYRRNSLARALKSGRSSTIGVVIAGSELFELPRILLGVESEAKSAGFWVTLASWQGGDQGDLEETLSRLSDQAVEGIAVIADRPLAVEALASVHTRVPTTVVMSGQVEGTGLSFVELDQVLGARLAVRHLLELGHSSVAHISGALRTFDARARVEGWRAELHSAGRGEGLLLEGDFTADSGFRLANELLERPEALPTAIFVGNDHMTMGVLAAFARRGVSVPEDVSLVGFDDIAGAGYLVPALTTVRQDFVNLGSLSIRILTEMMRGDAPRVARIPPDLVLRESTAAPRSGLVGQTAGTSRAADSAKALRTSSSALTSR
ncbi:MULTISPECIES: LacI family DNA-binding transcriptional regulator [Rathayibacter]|uniref:LacI family DNA-binding transcriptional regulator n=1 Tax=Rathayibacter TaxID=33886 RepID=UPI001E546B2C|nr:MULTISPECIES: LacI family DNA-binding transcriptional regulator [Rathayibacter]MCJ1695875.1 LacI family transcriptional regulator [Rathayibacter caricis]